VIRHDPDQVADGQTVRAGPVEKAVLLVAVDEHHVVERVDVRVADEAQAQDMARKLRAGGYGWGHAKQELAAALEAQLAPLRERYLALRADEARLDRLLNEGGQKARAVAQRTMQRVRRGIGIG